MNKKYFFVWFVLVLFVAGCATARRSNLSKELEIEYVKASERLREAQSFNAPKLQADTYLRAKKIIDRTRRRQKESPSFKQLNQYQYAQHIAHSATVGAFREKLRSMQETLDSLERTVVMLRTSGGGTTPVGAAKLKRLEQQLQGQSERIQDLGKQVKKANRRVEKLSGRLRSKNKKISELKDKVRRSEKELRDLEEENRRIRKQVRGRIQSGTVRIQQGRVYIKLPSTVMFESGNAELSSPALSTLREAAEVIKEFPERPVRVHGHASADSPATEASLESKWQLSNRRSVNVLKYLVYGRAVEKTRIASVAFGPLRPLSDGETKGTNLTDDRVELVVLPPRGVVYVSRSDTEKESQQELADRFETFLEPENVVRRWGRVAINLTSRLNFDPAGAEIKPEMKDDLNRVGRVLEATPTYPIRVQGHTDDLPPAPGSPYPSNWELSGARAVSVVRYFRRNFDLDGRNIGAVAMGQFYPLVPNASESNRKRNRRVEIHLLPDALSATD